MSTNLFANLENISVATTKHSSTLGKLARASDYLLFYVLSSSAPPNPTFLQNFQQFILACASSNNQNQSAATPKKKNFHATTSPAKLKRIFGIGKKPPAANENANGNGIAHGVLNFVVVDVEFSPSRANLSFIANIEQLYFLRPKSYLSKSRLLRALGFVNAPSLFVVECAKFKLVSQIYRELMDDPNGTQFPWKNPPADELFKREFLKKSSDGSLVKIQYSAMGNGVKGLFFGAKWCPPSRQMCKQLCEIYPKIKEKCPEFEIIFCSYDRTDESFREHFASMPWIALPYGDEKQLAKAYDVQGIPTFLLVDANFSLITRNGLNLLLSDPEGYPWHRKPIYELTELTAHRLSEMPSLILFTEGSPEDTEFSLQFLGACAESIPQAGGPLCNGQSKEDGPGSSSSSTTPNSAVLDPLQIFYTGEDPICDYILENLGQEQTDLPLLLICDVMAGHLAICDKPDVSEQVLLEFVDEYRAGRAKVHQIPGQKQRKSRIVAGIPAEVLQQLVIHQLPHSEFTRSA